MEKIFIIFIIVLLVIIVIGLPILFAKKAVPVKVEKKSVEGFSSITHDQALRIQELEKQEEIMLLDMKVQVEKIKAEFDDKVHSIRDEITNIHMNSVA